MRLVGDRSHLFTGVLIASWLALVAAPIALSVYAGSPVQGLPLLGVLLWFALLRIGRYLSPALRCDRKLHSGRAEAALAMCDRALAKKGFGAWVGARRLVWLNRRTAALLTLGRPAEALEAALEAIALSPDPETLANCAEVLLRLNRVEEADRAARLVVDLTRERSVLAHAVLAAAKLAQGMPAEAEALARSGLADVQALLPLVKPEHHVACLVALARAERALGERVHTVHEKSRLAPDIGRRSQQAPLEDLVPELRRAAKSNPSLQAVALLEEAEELEGTTQAQARALALLREAEKRAAGYVRWYVTQPGSLAMLQHDEQVAAFREAARAELASEAEQAPSSETVAQTLSVAEQDASPRPAPQASRGAISMQVLTLTGTLVLLLVWTWRFFVIG
jgi:tetratricopeptide (TPR) repeat protein